MKRKHRFNSKSYCMDKSSKNKRLDVYAETPEEKLERAIRYEKMLKDIKQMVAAAR